MIEINNKKLCESCFEEVESDGICPHCGFAKEEFSPDAMVLPLGTKLNDKIIIGRVMGKGGFGVTYLGYDLRMEKTIAVKEYYPNGIAYRSQSGTEVLVADPKSSDTFDRGTEKFYTEAEMVAQLNGNPNIVGVYDYFRANNTVYLIMEYLNGITLKNYVKKHGKITDGQALYVMDKMAAALSITHSAGVLHRDISPDNIMVCLDGKVKLIDFGAARQIVAESSSNLTVVMKPGYTPIEQYTKKGKQGAWTDIYALGASIYYAMTGKIIDDPYERMENDSEFTSNLHGINDSLWNVIKKCTMINSTDRYGSAIELRKALSTVSAPIKAEPIVLEPEDVKLVSQEEEKEKEEIKGFLAASLLDSEEPIELFPSKELESGVEEYESPAVSEEEGYKAGEDVYSKTEDKKKPLDKKLLFGIIGGAGALIVAALIIVFVVALPKAVPTGSNVSDPVYINYDNNTLWAEANAITKETLQSFGGDVRITLDLMTTNNTDAPFEHTFFRHTVNPQSLAGYLNISAENGYYDGKHSYDIYEGQTSFVFTVAKADIDAMEGDLVFMPNKLELHSATVEAYNGMANDTNKISFNGGYPGEWMRYEQYISKNSLLSYNGDVMVEVVCEFFPSNTSGYLDGYIKTINDNWNPVIVYVPNLMPDDGETVYRLNYSMLSQNDSTFVFIISRELIEGLSDKGLGFQVSNLVVKRATLRSANYGGSNGSTVSTGDNNNNAGGDAPEKEVKPAVVLKDFPDEYAGDWQEVGRISKDELADFGGDVRITFDITTGYFCQEDEPYFYLNLGSAGNGLVSEDVYGVRLASDEPGANGLNYGMTKYVIRVSRQEIENLPEDVWIIAHNIILNSVTLEDAEEAAAKDKTPGTKMNPTVFDYPDEYLGEWKVAATLTKHDLAAYGTDVKVTLELEGGDFDENSDWEWGPSMEFWYEDDGWQDAKDLLTAVNHQALPEDIRLPYGDSVFVFYISKENIEKLPTYLFIQAQDTIIKKATITAVRTFELDSTDPGDWMYGRSISKEDFIYYYPGDIKVTLQFERTNNYSQHEDWLDTDIYFYHLCVHDGMNRSVITSMFNLALATNSDRDGNFFLGGIIEEDAPESRTDIFEFVMTKEEAEQINTALMFRCANGFIRSATFEAYDPAEDAVSADAKVLELGLSWQNEGGTGTTDITKSDLESIGGDVLITLDITGELLDPNGDGIAHIYPRDSRDGKGIPLYARNQGAAEDHAYNSKYDFSMSYCLGYWEYLPDQVQFVITEEQIQNLGEWGIHFSLSNGHVTKAYLEPAQNASYQY